jgi:hypothetical protein
MLTSIIVHHYSFRYIIYFLFNTPFPTRTHCEKNNSLWVASFDAS